MYVLLSIVIIVVALLLISVLAARMYDKVYFDDFRRRTREQRELIKKQFSAPENVMEVKYIRGAQNLDYIAARNEYAPKKFYLWIEDNAICMYGEPIHIGKSTSVFQENLKLSKKIMIMVNDIDYFHITGQKIAMTSGSGGGVSLTGMVMGNAVAGSVGAIIGSRKKTEVNTEVVDDRNTILVYNNRESNRIEHIMFSAEAYDIFIRLIPKKEIEYVKSKAI